MVDRLRWGWTTWCRGCGGAVTGARGGVDGVGELLRFALVGKAEASHALGEFEGVEESRGGVILHAGVEFLLEDDRVRLKVDDADKVLAARADNRCAANNATLRPGVWIGLCEEKLHSSHCMHFAICSPLNSCLILRFQAHDYYYLR